MNMPLELCEARDPKGLYKLARAGKIKGVLFFILPDLEWNIYACIEYLPQPSSCFPTI